MRSMVKFPARHRWLPSAYAGEPDPTGVKEVADNAAPAVVNDVGDAASSNGVDTSCSDGSATASLCQRLGGAPAVNGAADSAVNDAITESVNDAASPPPDSPAGSMDSTPVDIASSSPAVPVDAGLPDSAGGGCCCYDQSSNPGKPVCSDGSNWCGASSCN